MNAFDLHAPFHRQIARDRRIDTAGKHQQRFAAHADRITAGAFDRIRHHIGKFLADLNADPQIRVVDVNPHFAFLQDLRCDGTIDLIADQREFLIMTAGFDFKRPLAAFHGHLITGFHHRVEIRTDFQAERKRTQAEDFLQNRADFLRLRSMQMNV